MDFKLDAYPVDDTLNGLRSTEQIRIIICYILADLNAPLSRSTVQSALYDNGIANYFEISQAIDNLIEVGAIDVQNEPDKILTVNDKGRKIAKELENELSVYIKNKAVKAAKLTHILEKRKQHNDFTVTKVSEKRYKISITMRSGLASEGESDELIHLDIFVTDSLQAESMRQSFFNNPVALYEKIIEGLTSDCVFKE